MKKNMNKTKTLRLGALLCIVSGALAVSCSNDEATAVNGGDALPEGMYPLEIGEVTIGVEGGEAQPWGAKTRVEETSETECAWSDGDVISVRIGDDGDVGTYKYTIDSESNSGTFTAVTPCYWQSTAAQDVTAWYTSPTYTSTTDGTTTIDLSDQSSGLAYVMKATAENVNYNEAAKLTFSHQLAKVRVKLKNGTSSTEASTVEINNYTSCTNTGGNVTASDEGWITMHHDEDNDVWEANVVPTTSIPSLLIRLNGSSEATVSGISELEAGKMHTLTITLHKAGTTVVDLSQQSSDYTISDDGIYYFTGTGTSSINVTGGNPTIYLESAKINTSGIGINITGGNPTIHAVGSDNTITGSTGIFVVEGSTVTIEGSSCDDVLKVTGITCPGIGGYVYDKDIYNKDIPVNCGNIVISSITLYAYCQKLSSQGSSSPAIGGAGGGRCGTITINNAIVYAYGVNRHGSTAIGVGEHYSSSYTSNAPTVCIQDNSIVHAHRGTALSNKIIDYIGKSDKTTGKAEVNANIDASSTVYCYTGNGDTVEKTVTGT